MWTTLALHRMAAASASGAFSAWATLPWACETSANAEIHAQQLRQQVAGLLLRQVVARAQHAHQRQRTWADLPAGNPGRKCRAVRLAAARASTAVQAVLINPRLDRRHIKDLVAQRLAIGVLGHRTRTPEAVGTRRCGRPGIRRAWPGSCPCDPAAHRVCARWLDAGHGCRRPDRRTMAA